MIFIAFCNLLLTFSLGLLFQVFFRVHLLTPVPFLIPIVSVLKLLFFPRGVRVQIELVYFL